MWRAALLLGLAAATVQPGGKLGWRRLVGTRYDERYQPAAEAEEGFVQKVTDVDGTSKMEPPIVRTPLGTLKGSIILTRKGRPIYSFRGIRYAEPPVGELRFKPPVPTSPWEGTVDATEDGFACPQEADYVLKTDEDCLFLNVYTTKLPSNEHNPKRPVMVWIHAGGWYGGSGNSAIHGPQYIMDQDIVLVTFNYRLGALGFISTGDNYLPGNYGMKDQVQALRWVKQNIFSFGGDPNQVTLAGLSAGGASVWFHMASNMSKGLFQRAIAMSSSINAQGDMVSTATMELAKKTAAAVGCSNESSKQIYKCLMKVPAQTIASSLDMLDEWGIDPVLIYYPVVEERAGNGMERFLEDRIDDLMLRGQFSHVPLLTGHTRDEFSWKALFVVDNSTLQADMDRNFNQVAPVAFMYENQSCSDYISRKLREFYCGRSPISMDVIDSLGKLYSDSIINFGVDRVAQTIASKSHESVYYYHFTYQGRYSFQYYPGTSKPYGVEHQDDSIYLFFNKILFPFFDEGSPEIPILERHTKLWANFVIHGNPIPEEDVHHFGTEWGEYNISKLNYMDISEHLKMQSALNKRRMDLWNKLFPLVPNFYQDCNHHHCKYL